MVKNENKRSRKTTTASSKEDSSSTDSNNTSNESSLEDLINEDINPYQVLGLDSSNTSGISSQDIKKAYRRKALSTHPDKAQNDEQRTQFHTDFQRVAFAYSVLSDENRRKLYDRTGSLSELDEFEDGSFRDLFSDLCKAEVTPQMIEQDKLEYRQSGEEEQDILKYYKEGKGDMEIIFENVIHTDVLKDEERIRKIIQKAIDFKRVPGYSKFTNESTANKKKRRVAAEKEAIEAEELAEELGLNKAKRSIKSNGGSSEDALALMIKSRHENKFNNLINQLEVKYGAQPPSKKKKKSASASSK